MYAPITRPFSLSREFTEIMCMMKNEIKCTLPTIPNLGHIRKEETGGGINIYRGSFVTGNY
jgi:hypothetical protein